jgi:hypothetical protein
MADALETLAQHRGSGCWNTGPSACERIRPLLQQVAKVGGYRAIQSLLSMHIFDRDYAAEKLYWMKVAEFYYDRKICETEGCYRFHGPEGINAYLDAEEKAQIADYATHWESDYP